MPFDNGPSDKEITDLLNNAPSDDEIAEAQRKLAADREARVAACEWELNAVLERYGFNLRVEHSFHLVDRGQ